MIKRTHVWVLMLILLSACQKDIKSNCRSVAFVIDKTNFNGKVIQTDTAIYWPEVCDSELVRFMALSTKPQPICGQPGCYMRLVIWGR